MRHEVKLLAALHRMPRASDDDEVWQDFETKLNAIVPPLTEGEAAALLPLFAGSEADDYFGSAWTLLHLLETSPQPIFRVPPSADDGYWLKLLYERQQGHAT